MEISTWKSVSDGSYRRQRLLLSKFILSSRITSAWPNSHPNPQLDVKANLLNQYFQVPLSPQGASTPSKGFLPSPAMSKPYLCRIELSRVVYKQKHSCCYFIGLSPISKLSYSMSEYMPYGLSRVVTVQCRCTVTFQVILRQPQGQEMKAHGVKAPRDLRANCYSLLSKLL